MKNIIFLSLLFLGLMSCFDDTYQAAGDDIGSKSKMVYFPIVTMKGDELYIVNAGSPFTDPGAEGTLVGKTTILSANITVDTSKPGIYRLVYSFASPEGFSASARRLVIVKNASPTAPDYSGRWMRDAGAKGVSTWIQLTPTTYAVSDPGGAAGVYQNYWVEATVTDGVPVIRPQQAGKQISATPDDVKSGTSQAFSGTTVGSTYAWTLLTAGYGEAKRTFVKQ